MQSNFMPEGSVRVNDVTVPMPVLNSMLDMIDIWYGDQQVRTYTGVQIPKGVTYADPAGSNVFQRQMRSAAVNSIFYDPAVLYLPWLKPDGVTRMDPASYTDAWWDPVNTGLGKTDLSKQPSVTTSWCGTSVSADCANGTATFDPGLYYVLRPGADPTDARSFVQYDLNGAWAGITPVPAGRLCTPAPGSGCCPASGCSLAQERQNFANWFVYYRTRALLMKAAMSEALSTQVGTAGNYKLRVGWGTINSTAQNIDGVKTDVIRAGVRNLDAAHLKNVLTGIQGVNPYGGTPLRQATVAVGAYFRRDALADNGSPWRAVPGMRSDGLQPLACRRSYELLTTDGYYNDDPNVFGHAGDPFPKELAADKSNIDGNDGPAYGADGTKGPDNPDGRSPNRYVAAHPYSDGQADKLADYAMAQYVVDLQPSLQNSVAPDPASGDVAYWQHLGMFTLGLGVTGQFDQVKDLPGLVAGTTDWAKGDKIDDLWHAALDTHGAFFSARNVGALTQGLKDAFGQTGSAGRSESGASVSTTTLSSSSFKYVPGYSPGTWTGSLKAFGFDASNNLGKTAKWEAATLLPSWKTRNIHTWDGTRSVAFDSSATGAWKSLVDPSPATQNALIDYIHGDQSNEGSSQPYRKRTVILGDFVDSPPTFVQNVIDLGYGNVPGVSSYKDYLARKGQRPNGVIFEGANDGMLHAFNATTGVEQYAYVPYAVLPKLANLASQTYGSSSNFHQDFVDGPQTEADAYIAVNGKGAAWTNLILGSFGGGAPGFYALDVTDLASFGDKTLLWEIDGGSGGAAADVGYIYSRIPTGVLPATGSVGSLKNGSWKAFVGNGAYSANGNAVLLIVDLASGAIDKVTLPTAYNYGQPNGLMGVQLAYNANREVVAAYAGDLQGNVWRIDFTGGGAPSVGFANAPLYRAVDVRGKPQPIVAPPAVYPRSVGTVVLFGTGKLIDLADSNTDPVKSPPQPQTFYGVWDPTPSGTVSTNASPFAASMAGNSQRSLLVQQTLSSFTPALPVTGTFWQVSANPVDFTSHLGWYMELSPVNAKQRDLFAPVVLGQWVLINTMAPGAQPAPQSCDQSLGTSTYFLLPAESGASPTSAPVWDVNGDGVVDAKDSATQSGDGGQAAGYSTDSSGGDTTTVGMGSSSTAGRNMTGTQGDGDRTYDLFCVSNCKIKSRVWRQLMTPPF